MAEPVVVVGSGGVPVVDATPGSGTPLTNPATVGVMCSPVASGGRPVTIHASYGPPVVFVNAAHTEYLPGGEEGGGGDELGMEFDNELNSQYLAVLDDF